MAKPRRTIVLAVESDEHAGSTTAICPPEGVRMDDGGTYTPSKPQLWLWEKREQFLAEVARTQREEKADLWVVLNGDAVEGDHHNTSQIISKNPDAQHYVMTRVFGQITALKPARLFVIRGTEAHTGSAGSAEEALAKQIGAERDTETGNWSRWRLRLSVNGVLVDFQHHGRFGSRTWTRQNVLSALAFQIWAEHALNGQRHPDVAFRSHLHQHGDSGNAYPTRVVQTPAWQLKTAHAHKVAAESIASVGGIIMVVDPEGQYRIVPKLYLPDLPKVV